MGYHFILNKSVRPQKTEDTEFSVQFSSVQSLSCVWLLATPWIAACQASVSITNSRSLPKLIEYYWGKKYLGILIHCWQTLSGCNLVVSRMEEPGRLQSMGSLRVRQDWAISLSLFTLMHWRRKWQPTPVFLPGESQGRGSLLGCRLWGRIELDTTDAIASRVTQQQT